MGRLKGGANTSEEAERLSLSEINKLIVYAEWRFKDAKLNSAMRRDAFDRLVWLERQRESVHGVEAPDRRRPRRNKN
jgi:predicted metal-dependent TIM-barrel fold hydrolase